MHRLIRHRPSPAMVVACLALLVALTGTSGCGHGARTELRRHRADPRERGDLGEDQEPQRDRRQDRRWNAVSGSLVLNGSLTPPARPRETRWPPVRPALGRVPPVLPAPPARSVRSPCARPASPCPVRCAQLDVLHADGVRELQRQREGDLGGHRLER